MTTLRGISCLIVDDEIDTLEDLQAVLSAKGANVSIAADGVAALAAMERQPCDICLVDLVMPRMNGLDLLRRLKDTAPGVDVIVITGYGSIQSAVEAMKAGAADYITKPIDGDELFLAMERLCQARHLLAQNQYFIWETEQQYQKARLIGEHPRMQEVYRKIELAARTSSTVLITGESGTGKELVASAIHYHSGRREAPFIRVNCGALTHDLLESELFGHEKGAFTGAVQRRPGRFELADEGTLFLDEISTSSPRVQVALLRVLQEGEFERVGGTQTVKVDVRLISATNLPLDRLTAGGGFREDLFYRLNVIAIDLPPLRDRRSDLPLLVSHFLEAFSRKLKRPRLQITPSAMMALEAHSWPGNIRELENTIESAVVLSTDSVITPDDLPATLVRCLNPLQPSITHKEALHLFERQLLSESLRRNQGHVELAARDLGLPLSTFYRKIQVHQIDLKEDAP